MELTPEPTGDWSVELLDEKAVWFKDSFADHPTLALNNAAGILRKSIAACLDSAGSVPRYHAVLSWALTESNSDTDAVRKRYESVSRSRLLGGFVQKMFPAWIAEYDRVVAEGSYTPDDDFEEYVEGIDDSDDASGQDENFEEYVENDPG